MKRPRRISAGARKFLDICEKQQHNGKSIIHHIREFLKRAHGATPESASRLDAIIDYLEGVTQLERAAPRRSRYPVKGDLIAFCRDEFGLHLPEHYFDKISSTTNIVEEYLSRRGPAIGVMPYCGKYSLFAPHGTFLRNTDKDQNEIDATRTVIVSITPDASEARFFFTYAEEKYAANEADTYFFGEVFASNDRLFLVGYDFVLRRDWILLTLQEQLEPGKKARIFRGIETFSFPHACGARRVVLQSLLDQSESPELEHGKLPELKQNKLSIKHLRWLTAKSELIGAIAEFPASRQSE